MQVKSALLEATFDDLVCKSLTAAYIDLHSELTLQIHSVTRMEKLRVP
jgi:hypothetical protein